MPRPADRSLRPPPLSGASSSTKGKAPVRANPQFEAYHNPYKISAPESSLEQYVGDAGVWLKPLALLLTIALMVAFVVLCPPPGYESSGGHGHGHGRELELGDAHPPPPPPTPDLLDQTHYADGDGELPETWVEAALQPVPSVDEGSDAQRIFRIVHRPR